MYANVPNTRKRGEESSQLLDSIVLLNISGKLVEFNRSNVHALVLVDTLMNQDGHQSTMIVVVLTRGERSSIDQKCSRPAAVTTSWSYSTRLEVLRDGGRRLEQKVASAFAASSTNDHES